MTDAGTVDSDAIAAIGTIDGELVTPTAEQAEAAATLLASDWAAALG